MLKNKILFVDDEYYALDLLKDIFEGEKYEVVTATSAFAALVLLAKTPGILVVIADQNMPGTTGIEFLREVCILWPETTRILVSGGADEHLVQSAIDRGEVHTFVAKPWRAAELVQTVNQCIGASKAGAT